MVAGVGLALALAQGACLRSVVVEALAERLHLALLALRLRAEAAELKQALRQAQAVEVKQDYGVSHNEILRNYRK
jgi:hypothetical protein